jgi:hypothetical protein
MSPNPTLTQDALAALRVEAERRAAAGAPLLLEWSTALGGAFRTPRHGLLNIGVESEGPRTHLVYTDRRAPYEPFETVLAAQHFAELMLAHAAAPLRALMDDDGLESIMREIDAWQRITFPHATLASISEHLRREAEELAAKPDDLEEVADVFFLLTGLVARLGGPDALKAAVLAKFEKNKARKWNAPDAQGVCQHVDESPRPEPPADEPMVPLRVLERACAIAASGGFAYGYLVTSVKTTSPEQVLGVLIEEMRTGKTVGQGCGLAMGKIATAAIAAAEGEARG